MKFKKPTDAGPIPYQGSLGRITPTFSTVAEQAWTHGLRFNRPLLGMFSNATEQMAARRLPSEAGNWNWYDHAFEIAGNKDLSLDYDPEETDRQWMDTWRAQGFKGERRMLSQDEANEKYGIKGFLSFDGPTTEIEAFVLNKRKRQEVLAQWTGDKAYGLDFAGYFAVEMAAGLLDPLNFLGVGLIDDLVKGVGTGLAGTTGAGSQLLRQVPSHKRRFVEGFEIGAASAALVEPIIYHQAQQEKADYTLDDSLLKIGFSGAVGGAFAVIGGAVGDLVRSSASKQAKEKAMDTAANQADNGDIPDVGPIFDGDNTPPKGGGGAGQPPYYEPWLRPEPGPLAGTNQGGVFHPWEVIYIPKRYRPDPRRLDGPADFEMHQRP